MARREVSYDGYDLQNANVATKRAQHFSGGTKRLDIEDKGNEHRQSLLNAWYKRKTIVVEGYLSSTSESALHLEVDDLKEALDQENANLDIAYAGSTRRYKATVASVEIPEDFYNLSWVPYQIEFICVDPFGYATSTTTRAIDTIATAALAATVTFAGNFSPDPSITITLEDVDALTEIKLKNDDIGDEITITTAFADDDVIIINNETKKVTREGTEIDYGGYVPDWNDGSNNFTLSFTGGTETTADLSFVYTPKYL